jgi:hypothetical protein
VPYFFLGSEINLLLQLLEIVACVKIIYIVTYSQVLFTMELYKSATLGTHVHVRPARSRNTHSYRILPTGPLPSLTAILAVG